MENIDEMIKKDSEVLSDAFGWDEESILII
jgi:hypothetical protein